MSTQPPDPSRFTVYTELKDGSGFTIKGTEFVFKFDRFGGWFDQHGNYYNCDGDPEDPPSESEHSHSDYDRSEGAHSDYSEDEYQKEFGRPKHVESDEEEVFDPYFEKVQTNLSIINTYPQKTPFRVYFRNLPYITKRQVAFHFFREKVPSLLNVIFLENEKGQFNGNGYFIAQDYKTGEELLKLQGLKYEGRSISFQVVDVDTLIYDPVYTEEMYPDFKTKAGKKYVNKGSPVKAQSKVEEKPEKIEEKPAKIEQSPKKEEKSENGQQFASFKFLKKSFPKKSSFKEWVMENQFNHEADVKSVEKIEGNLDYALVTMKMKIFNKLNGTFYDGTKIVFEPQK